MGERKIVNKYILSDFDPAKIPRRRQPKNHQMKVRMMLPMSVRCKTCGDYVYQGTKSNSRKEEVIGERYLEGIKIYRFYTKCTRCSSEIVYKTDPGNSDYVVESGARRNFEPWRAEEEEADKEKRKRKAEEMGDAMKSLENRSLDSKREMDKIASLDELKSMKSRQATVSADAMLEIQQRSKEEEERKWDEGIEALTKFAFKGRRGSYVRRIDDEVIDDDEEDLALAMPANGANSLSKRRRKLDQEQPGKPTDELTKASLVSKDGVDVAGSSNGRKFIFKSSTVAVSIKKKPPSVSYGNMQFKQKVINSSTKEVNQELVDISTTRSTGLQSLCQRYDSEEDG